MSLRRTTVILAAAALLALAGCGGGKKESGNAPALDPHKRYLLDFETNHGPFTITVDQVVSPNVSASMVALAKKGYFDNTICHRIVPSFVIQCGDPTGTGTGGPGYTTHDDVPPKTEYTYGVVAMAKTQTEPPGTAGSQFFIVINKNIHLPPEYALLGEVSGGLDTVKKLATLGNAETQKPREKVLIEKVTVRESG